MTRDDDFSDAVGAEDVPGFKPRDILRFFMVDLIIVFALKLCYFIGVIETGDRYVLSTLAGKTVLALYLMWIVRERTGGWRCTGADGAGRLSGWILSFVTYAASVPAIIWLNRINSRLYAAFFEWAGWQYYPAPQKVTVILFEADINPAVRTALLVFVAVAGPCLEELAFRGVGYDAFNRKGGRLWALIASGGLFGLYHFDAELLLPLSCIGLAFGLGRMVTGSLWCSVFLHMLHNVLTLGMMAYDRGFMRLWGETAAVPGKCSAIAAMF